ncbi:MAG: lytic transglycosylase domain-containing protein [Marinilabiliales bacterium]
MKNNIPKFFIFFFCIVIISTIVIVFSGFENEQKNDDDKIFRYKFQKNYAIYSIDIPDTIYFAGVRIPVEFEDVYESLDKEILINTYWQSSTLLFIKRANKYFPIIEPILKKHDIPDDFKYISLIESGLTNVKSPAGATGYWQFMKQTALEFGLEVNSEVDERYDIEKSTEAACLYFKRAYEKYHDWILVAASYNVGMGALDKQLERQKADSYFNLVLNSETARYVYRMVAVKLILSDPQKFGFHCRKKDMYYFPEYDTVHVDTSISNLADFAAYYNISYKELKFLNPWLIDITLSNNQGKKYIIKIPKTRLRNISEKIQQNHGDTLLNE